MLDLAMWLLAALAIWAILAVVSSVAKQRRHYPFSKVTTLPTGMGRPPTPSNVKLPTTPDLTPIRLYTTYNYHQMLERYLGDSTTGNKSHEGWKTWLDGEMEKAELAKCEACGIYGKRHQIVYAHLRPYPLSRPNYAWYCFTCREIPALKEWVEWT